MRTRSPASFTTASLLFAALAAHGAAADVIPIAHWTFDSPATQRSGSPAAVDTVAGLPATLLGEAGRVTMVDGAEAQRGGAIRLNPGDVRKPAVLRVEDHPSLTGHADGREGLTSLTIEADVRLDTLAGQAQIVRKTDGDVGYELYILKDGRVGFRVKGAKKAGVVASKNRIEPDGRWHRIQATWAAERELYNFQVVVDGVVSRATRDLGPLTDTESPLFIGGFVRERGDIGQPLSGWVDNVAISTGQVALLDKSGEIDPTPVEATGRHLLSQPGFVSAGFVADPPATPECHAETIIEREDGSLLVAWFGGTCEGHVDVGVWQSGFVDGAWSTPREVATAPRSDDGAAYSLFNPVLFQYPDGPTLLFYMAGELEGAWGMLQRSDDGGRTWSEPERLPKGIRGATKNKPVLIDSGVLLCPDNGRHLKIDRTADFGRTWLESAIVPDPEGLGAIQPTILTHKDGSLQVLARSSSGRIVESWSTDGGETWSPLAKTSLPNNNSGLDAVTLADGRHLLVYNHVALPEGKWGGPRTPLNVAVSEDGKTWQAAVVLEDEKGEYSYPAVIQARDGKVHVAYTWRRVRVKHAVLDPAAFSLRPIVDGQWPQQ